MLAKGDIVWTFFDDGRGGTYCSGLVSRAGPKTFTVTWVSGRVQRFPQGHREIVKVPEYALSESMDYLRAAGVLPAESEPVHYALYPFSEMAQGVPAGQVSTRCGVKGEKWDTRMDKVTCPSCGPSQA